MSRTGVLVLVVLLIAGCAPKEQDSKPANSPEDAFDRSFMDEPAEAKVLSRNPDGTVLVAAKPRFGLRQNHASCFIHGELSACPPFVELRLKVDGELCVDDHPELRRLDHEREHRFLLEPLKGSGFGYCRVARVWDGDKLVVHANEARKTFSSIAERLTVIVQDENSDVVMTRDATSFRAEYDTMSYTVHLGSKRRDYSPGTRQETGPGTSGFVITLSVTPLERTAARSGQIMQRQYWREYFWTGHADDSEYIRLVFKFGSGVDEAFKERVIEAVTRGAGGPGSSTALASPPAGDVNPVDEMLDRDEDLRRRFQKIAKGMTEAQVRAIMGGPPHKIIRTTRWVYNLSFASDTWTERNWRLVVDFSGDKVERFEESYDCYYIGFTFDE